MGIKEVAITGSAEATEDMERLVWDSYRPDIVLAVNRGAGSTVPLLADRDATGTATAYVCEQLVCGLPVTSVDDLVISLG